MTERAMKRSTYRQISKIHWSRGCTCAPFSWTYLQFIRLHGKIWPGKHKPCLRLQKKVFKFSSQTIQKIISQTNKKNSKSPLLNCELETFLDVLQLWSSFYVIHTSRALQAYGCICVRMSMDKWGRPGSFKEVKAIWREQDCLWRCVDLWGMRWK